MKIPFSGRYSFITSRQNPKRQTFTQPQSKGCAMPAGWDPTKLIKALLQEEHDSSAMSTHSSTKLKKETQPPKDKSENRRLSARLSSQSPKQSLNDKDDSGFASVDLASGIWDHFAALNLLYEQFVSFGYSRQNEMNPVRIADFNLQKSSYTFVAKQKSKIVGTITCVGWENLPSEKQFFGEISRLRHPHRRLVEVAGLATNANGGNTKTVMELIRSNITFSRLHLQATDLIIAVNPRHVRYYKKVMLFKQASDETICKHANGAPAVLMHLDLATMKKDYEAKYSRWTGARNLHSYLFHPEKEALQLKGLRENLSARNRNWEQIQKFLTILYNQSMEKPSTID